MAVNNGKRFETNFKKSIPDNVYYYRFKDGTASWDSGTTTRFQQSNKCDCELFYNKELYNFELKSHKGKSVPISCIRKNQLEELLYASQFGINAGLIVEFSDIKEYYYLNINDYNVFLNATNRKSIPLDLFQKKGIKINIELKKVNVKLNIENLLKDIVKK